MLKRERTTIEKINGKNWTDSFHKKAIDTYYHFRGKSIEFTDHGVARYLSRMTEEQFWEIHNKPFNYKQEDGKLVKYYGNTAIIYMGVLVLIKDGIDLHLKYIFSEENA